jgi:hypothetical protein
MTKTTIIYASTKITKEHDAVKTKITLDYEGLTDDQIRAYADDACVIKAQASFRSKGFVPAEFIYKVPVPGTRTATAMTPFEMLCGVFGKERALELVNKYGTVEAAAEAVKGFLDNQE